MATFRGIAAVGTAVLAVVEDAWARDPCATDALQTALVALEAAPAQAAAALAAIPAMMTSLRTRKTRARVRNRRKLTTSTNSKLPCAASCWKREHVQSLLLQRPTYSMSSATSEALLA